jgi:hypothetical protein
MHFRFQNPRRQQRLTPAQESKRLLFSENQLMSSINWYTDVVISDESRFSLHDDSRRVWVKRGVYNAGTFRQEEKFSKSIMVWGAIGYGWRSSLVVVKGNLNADGYIHLLDENKILDKLDVKYGERNYYFQYDGAPAHRAKRAVEWIKNRANTISDWPPNSPDLSAIENIWGILKSKIARRDPQSMRELEQFLMEEWDNMNQQVIDMLLSQASARFKMVVHEKGKQIGHLLHKIAKPEIFEESMHSENDEKFEIAPPITVFDDKCTTSDWGSSQYENCNIDQFEYIHQCKPKKINVLCNRNGSLHGQLEYCCGKTIWLPNKTLKDRFPSLLIDYLTSLL